MQLRQSMHIYEKNIPAKFHSDRIRKDGRSNKNKKKKNNNNNNNNNKISSDIRSVPDQVI